VKIADTNLETPVTANKAPPSQPRSPTATGELMHDEIAELPCPNGIEV